MNKNVNENRVATADRRQKKLIAETERRVNRRRKEDFDNIKVYYGALCFSAIILLTMGITSFIWGR